MAGLLNGQPPGQPPMPAPDEAETPGAEAQAQAAGTEDESGQGEPASPEEQAQYDQFVKNAAKIIYANGKVSPAILKALDGAGDPKSGLANVTVMVVSRVAQSADEAGQDISGDVILHAGLEIITELAHVQGEAGIADMSSDDIENCFYKAVDLYRDQEQKTGRIDEAGLEEDFKTLMEANDNGNIDEVVPGASKAADRFTKKGEAPPPDAAPEGNAAQPAMAPA